MPSLHVHDLPHCVPAEELDGRTVVVVDLLRASSTICRALASGARSVIPVVEVDAARALAASAAPREVLLGGERGGRRIAGFDLGNSPAEYLPSVVLGKQIVFTTTNGAKAIAHARFAARLTIGAFLNRLALVESLADDPDIDILCAGTDGQVTREDILAAGALVDLFLASGRRSANRSAEAAHQLWQDAAASAKLRGRPLADHLAEELRFTEGGRNLIALGMERDLGLCSQIDSLDVVPALDRASGELRLR